MAQGKFIEVWSGLPPWAKGLTVVGTLGLIGFGTIRVYSDVKAKKNAKVANQDSIKANNDLAILAQNNVHPSYVQSDYSGMADTINQAISGCGNDTDTIKGVLGRMKNTADILSLVSAYGVRSASPCVANPFDVTNGTWAWITNKLGVSSVYSGSLPQSLKAAYISYPDTITEFNSILTSNSVNYQF